MDSHRCRAEWSCTLFSGRDFVESSYSFLFLNVQTLYMCNEVLTLFVV